MLILTRKVGEAINIGDDIKITVLGIQGQQVRLGIVAPQSVAVHREEIYLKIQQENKKASQTPKEDVDQLAEAVRSKHLEGSSPKKHK